ncbi:phosphoenolpyruvate--protein phosphotransferase [Anaerocolumna xylanovorans]|uniref:Phosphoenolpyruvate-protein phosphotransferase n=1 Tax=Anaerocolumna xylanovorans DSM 12503 TaxID=1121345 RepID=A0A1M7YBG7_9FIRM|nr:phosphoenolpyruvate--protein phosphotransferase [Anaerocolumna xylanovorans]SHO50000.1 phosphoenolpyruvate--protein phosphotransferase [Anaerocolumna xylanovorans DSM 12503]
MNRYKGKSAFPSIAIGKIMVLKKQENTISRTHIDDTGAEIERFEEAKKEALLQLNDLYQKACKEAGEANAAVFEVHQMMLTDEDFLEAVKNIIELQSVNAEYAVSVTADNFAGMFADLDDDYMKERAIDVKDVAGRVVNILSQREGTANHFEEPVIILAEDLTPSETVQLDKEKVLAFVTKSGSLNSHTVILARTMNIPALVSTDIDILEEYNGVLAIVDGHTGHIYLNPDEETLSRIKEKQAGDLEERKLLQELKGKETVTKAGQKIHLYANIGSENDLGYVLQNGAEGIGLFRSEFLYLENRDYPTEEQQFCAYKKVLETMGGKKVIIRTLDIGADKQIDYFGLEREENPAMGYRAVRICLDRPDIFKTQLRALYRASVFGNLSIMVPMIISAEEVTRVKQIIQEVKDELDEDGMKYCSTEFGIMIETPAAVMISGQLAKEVDFFSIGTNDLTQYTLAIDRQNPKLDKLYNPHHPALMEMINITVQNAHKNGIWVGICGELASDLTITDTLVSLGADELSVSPSYILPLRKKIREM